MGNAITYNVHAERLEDSSLLLMKQSENVTMEILKKKQQLSKSVTCRGKQREVIERS